MRWFTIYTSENNGQKVVRIHDIGDRMNVLMEMRMGALKLDDPTILALVEEKNVQEVAEFLSKKVGLHLEN